MQTTPSSTVDGSRESSEQRPGQLKDHHVLVFEENFENSPQAERRRHHLYRWALAIWWRLESKFPRVTQRTKRFLFYMRGPRPVVDLPGSSSSTRNVGYPLTLHHVEPSPWIATLTIRGRTYGLPLERRVVRLTRPLQETLDPAVPGGNLHNRPLLFRSHTILLDTCRVMGRLYRHFLERKRRMWA